MLVYPIHVNPLSALGLFSFSFLLTDVVGKGFMEEGERKRDITSPFITNTNKIHSELQPSKIQTFLPESEKEEDLGEDSES